MNLKLSLIFVFCLSIFFSCQKETQLKETQIAYFEITYTHYTFGSGFIPIMIDGDRNVLRYPTNSFFSLKHTDDSNQISAEDLLHNISQTDTTVRTIPQMEWDIAIDKIPTTLNSSLKEEQCAGADQGTYLYYAYHLLENGKYQKILLGERGDCNRYSDVLGADDLVDFINTYL